MIDFLRTKGIETSDEMEQSLKSTFHLEEYKKRDYFHREQYICNKIGFLIEGQISHFYNVDGQEITRWISLQNSFVTSFGSFVNALPSLDSIRCITPCKMLVATRNDFLSLKEKFPQIQKLWIETIEQEMTGFELRVYELIASKAEDRYLSYIQKYPNYREIPQKYLASMLGIAPRHLSRIRKKLASKK